MPSKSKAQARMMAAAAHDDDFAKKVGVPQKTAREFNQGDKGGKLLKKGDVKPRGNPFAKKKR
jgi:hypothetical protein